jgi:hypothetical protein
LRVHNQTKVAAVLTSTVVGTPIIGRFAATRITAASESSADVLDRRDISLDRGPEPRIAMKNGMREGSNNK